MAYTRKNHFHIREVLPRPQWSLILAAVLCAALCQSGCVAPGNLSVSPSNLNFGNVVIGTTSNQNLTITNSSNEAFTIAQAAVSDSSFKIKTPSLPLTLMVGQSATFTMGFAPSA